MLTRDSQVKQAAAHYAPGCAPLGASVGSRAFSRRPPHVIPAFFQLLNAIIGLFVWALILSAIFSTLASFGVLDTRNRLVWTIGDFLTRVTEPMLRPIRSVLPYFGNIDISPIVAILLLQYIARPLLATVFAGLVYGNWSLM